MAGYPGLGRIKDPDTQAVCKALFDANNGLLRRLAQLEAEALRQGSPFQAGGERISNLGLPQDPADAVSVAYLRQVLAARGGGAVGAVDTNGALDADPLSVRVDGSTIVKVGNQLVATVSGSGITQLTGDVLAGPGSGSQVATIPTLPVAKGGTGSTTFRAGAATVSTEESTTSLSYTDLATSGPSVTLTTGATVLIWMSCYSYKTTAGNTGFLSVDVSGATTIAAADVNSAFAAEHTGSFGLSVARVLTLVVTPGSNTFKLRYRVDGGTFFFGNRSIAVLSL